MLSQTAFWGLYRDQSTRAVVLWGGRCRGPVLQPGTHSLGLAEPACALCCSSPPPPGKCADDSLVFSVCFSVALRWRIQGIESTKESSSILQWLPAFCWFWQLHMRRPGSSSHQPFSFFSSWWSSQTSFREGLSGLVTEQASKWMESSFFVTVGTEVGSEPRTDTAKTVCAFIKFIRSSQSVIYSCNCVSPGRRQELPFDVPLWAAAGLRWGYSLGGRCAGTCLLTALVCAQRGGRGGAFPSLVVDLDFSVSKTLLKK